MDNEPANGNRRYLKTEKGDVLSMARMKRYKSRHGSSNKIKYANKRTMYEG